MGSEMCIRDRPNLSIGGAATFTGSKAALAGAPPPPPVSRASKDGTPRESQQRSGSFSFADLQAKLDDMQGNIKRHKESKGSTSASQLKAAAQKVHLLQPPRAAAAAAPAAPFASTSKPSSRGGSGALQWSGTSSYRDSKRAF